MLKLLQIPIASQIENRINFKRATKMAIASTLRMGAEGIKVKLGGRLGGAEIARSEEIKQGRTPLHTFRMDIDYANVFAQTVYGKIGIKVWICKGEVLGKRDLNPNFIGGKKVKKEEIVVVVIEEVVAKRK
jgi:small subunit ribosomal protein S3